MPYNADEPRYYATLAEALQTRTVEALKPLAAVVSGEKGPTRKTDLIAFIERQLEGSKLRAVWDRLDETQKAAVAEAVHGDDPVFRADRFKAKYGKLPDWGKRDRWMNYITEPSLLAVFFVDSVMPDDLRRRLATFVPKPEEVSLQPVGEPPEKVAQIVKYWDPDTRKSETVTNEIPVTRRDMERAAIHDLQAMLHLIDTGKVAVSDKTRLPGKATTKAVTALLLDGDFYDDAVLSVGRGKYYAAVGPIRAFAWPLLVQAGGLAALTGKTLNLTRAGRKALGEPPEKTLRTLWNKWQKTTLLDELSRIDCIKGQTGKGKRGLTAVKSRREAIDLALRDCEPGAWTTVNDFFNYMVATGIDFEVTRNPWDLYVAEPHYGSLGYEGFHNWTTLQGRYTLCLLFEYAATLGLIDVAYIPPHGARPDYRHIWGTDDLDFFSRYDGLLYFRLTPLGAYCVGMADSYQPAALASKAALRVLPNLEVVAAGEPLSPADELLLNSFAVRKGDMVWRLDRDALLAALEEGRDITGLRDFLEAHGTGPLPETVEQLIKDAAERADQMQVKGLARLIECADPALAALIANDSRTKPFCLLAGERHLVVYADAETRFRSALRKLGYTLPK